MKIKNVTKMTLLKVTGIALSFALVINITTNITEIKESISDSDSDSLAIRITTVVRDSIVIKEYLVVRDSLVLVRDTLSIAPYDSTEWQIYGPGPRVP